MTGYSENIYTAVGFRSSEPDGSLKIIEIFGLSGQRINDNQVVVTPKTQTFFDDLIVRKIFRQSCRIRKCDFKSLKIWLYDTKIMNKDRSYDLPKIDEHDLVIRSNVPYSNLEQIYVLDNNLKGDEYQEWRSIAEELFTPLFLGFVAPPEAPEIIAENPIVKTIGSLFEPLDPYGKMKQKILFNSLIIQID
ncbi:hypothetical protein OGM63_28475 [Plectonema radiosum NIES-515]|uniref:Uncharacterized protein n=1 Tax=Plectonema radiosum NIES-515 TaxID=2986073 RepID=A0ABT3B7P1_9CYAN|nr:hypothetical protein [Plectonema radiosum]MCV3217398.1 hypothetical protein [Plectonema radiosum NIES-515]